MSRHKPLFTDDDIRNAMEVPLTSEPDRMDLGLSDEEWMDSEGVDDTDMDPDFQPCTDSELSDDDGNELEPANLNISESDDNMNDSATQTSNSSVNNCVIAPENRFTTLRGKYNSLTKIEKQAMKIEEEDKWQIFEGKQQQFDFLGRGQFSFNLPPNNKPADYFYQYITDDLIEVMVIETNRNADQVISNIRLNRSSRLRKWKPTNNNEMKKFLGLILYMGLVPMPRISDYWSMKTLYKNFVASKIMSRNRFQLLLRFWHFNNNQNMEREGRLAKLSPLIAHLNTVFKQKKSPNEEIVIDESMVPFRGRLVFRQYLPAKTHKYGIKIFKICDSSGYTYKVIVYMGKGTGGNDGMSLASSVVMDLISDYLDKGHTLYIDNFYTSVDLANTLLSRQTHLVGTVTSNRAWFPHKKIISTDKSLKKGEMNCLEYPTGIVYTRWLDKREVRIMSTKHPVEFVDTGKKNRRGEPTMKPLAIVEYNKAKIGIDVSDQMSSYSTPVRKSMRWYHKVAEEFILGTAVVNSWLAYREIEGANIVRNRKNLLSITSFKEQLVYELTGLAQQPEEQVKTTGHHYLEESNDFVGEGKSRRRVRRACKNCYKNRATDSGRQAARNLPRVTTFCKQCPNKPYLCKVCFKTLHK